jgi:hypothetical protein
LLTCSRNTNSFGLRGCILVAEDGEAWEIAVNDLNTPQHGRSYRVDGYRASTSDDRPYDFADYACSRGWELPRRLPQAPQEAVDQAWERPGK